MSNTVQMPKPRTEAQRAAARANGAKSKGPVTEDGKAKSALNAVRHGLLACSLILRTESQPKFLAILNGYLDEYQPEGQTENNLVEDIAAAQWMKERCWVLTTALLDITMDQMEQEIAKGFNEIDNGTRTALAFLRQADQGAGLVLLNRMRNRNPRQPLVFGFAEDLILALQNAPYCRPGQALVRGVDLRQPLRICARIAHGETPPFRFVGGDGPPLQPLTDQPRHLCAASSCDFH
jgi:hypothetical protein